MPSGKGKVHQRTGKLKDIGQKNSKNVVSSMKSQDTTSESDNCEVKNHFEVELCWCIHQLENSINSNKLNEKQEREICKSLKILKSSNQPLIKKRQLMRETFGDYRRKMAEEEKKFSLRPNQFFFDSPAPKGEKSFFIKKSVFINNMGDNDFKFNFPITPKLEDLNIADVNKCNIKSEENQTIYNSDFKFIPSNNDFKFNFFV